MLTRVGIQQFLLHVEARLLFTEAACALLQHFRASLCCILLGLRSNCFRTHHRGFRTFRMCFSSCHENGRVRAVRELAINTATRRSLGKGLSPFKLSHARDPRLPFNLHLPVQSMVLDADGNLTAHTVSTTSVPRAQQMFGHSSVLMSVAREALHTSVNRMNMQADKSRRDVEFQVGQQVLLSTKYMRKQMSSGNKTVVPKLLPRYIGPFEVTAKVGPLACRLDLKGLRAHPVFHVSLLNGTDLVAHTNHPCLMS